MPDFVPRFLLGMGLVLGLAAPADAALRMTGPSLPGRGSRHTAEPQRPKARVAAHIPVTGPAMLARAKGQPVSLRVPAIEMEHLNTHAVLQLRPDQKGGGFSQRQMRGLSDFLRCHHTQKRRPMDPRLVSLLYATSRHYNNAKVWVVAGYRAPKIALAKGNPQSPHKRGVACDFRLAGVELTNLRDYLRRAYPRVGVGYYPNSGFVHLDVGRQQSAFWIDYSAPGQRARYSSDPTGDLSTGAAERTPAPLPPAPEGIGEDGWESPVETTASTGRPRGS